MEKFFSYYQIVSLGIFLILVIGKAIYVKRREKINPIKINFFSKEVRKHLFEIIMFLSVMLWTVFVLLYSIKNAFGSFKNLYEYKIVNFLPLKIIGVFFIFLGFIIFILALLNLGNSWRLGIDEKNPGRLVTSGIYSISRHPIYLFFDLYFFGTFFINGNIIFLIYSIILAAILHIQILREEKFLRKKFRHKYEMYCKSVSRYFSFKSLISMKKIIYVFKLENLQEQ